ncbi:MAG: hypothetical protein AAF432_13025 [Planctomycetota bacterium]
MRGLLNVILGCFVVVVSGCSSMDDEQTPMPPDAVIRVVVPATYSADACAREVAAVMERMRARDTIRTVASDPKVQATDYASVYEFGTDAELKRCMMDLNTDLTITPDDQVGIIGIRLDVMSTPEDRRTIITALHEAVRDGIQDDAQRAIRETVEIVNAQCKVMQREHQQLLGIIRTFQSSPQPDTVELEVLQHRLTELGDRVHACERELEDLRRASLAPPSPALELMIRP